ncbi:DMT family transporter [Tolumonas auensis]|uniref:DMT family transporter n=1 Tax=Tolumonas auensis TaxID=43948 RepID=UPI002AA8D8F4|nr:DMT family transporter [Tolumonas auensis]
MGYLVIVTLIWAFSFSLIGEYLAGQVDSYFAVLTRTFLAALVFLPFLRRRWLNWKLAIQLMLIGAIQLGVMYIFYYRSFLLLTVPEVLIFTIFTPIYITLYYDWLARRFSPYYLLTAVLSVIGAALIRYDALTSDYLLGFLVVQGANICFAIGQVAYKQLLAKQTEQPPHLAIFGCFHLGALLVSVLNWFLFGKAHYPEHPTQWAILIWLGAGASGLGYFLWNKGATLVNAGALAIMNNALIPAGLIVNLLIWNRDTNLLKLLTGGGVILLSLYLNERYTRRRKP